jgi:hypothetical protein
MDMMCLANRSVGYKTFDIASHARLLARQVRRASAAGIHVCFR